MTGDRGRLWLVPLALLLTGLLAGVATWATADRIESELQRRAQSALGAAGLPADGVSFTGRDATVQDVPADKVELARYVVRGVEGVRDVQVSAAAPARRPAPARPEPARQPRKEQLQEQLDALLQRSPITFEAYSSELSTEGETAVAGVADLLAAAPARFRFEVGGHVARVPEISAEEARQLSQDRAETVADLLVDQGVADDRVTSVGYGDTRPLGGDDDISDDRRVEIRVL
ncbi:OmpA family protein [Prauserella oleivorans]|uniref:OmpA family protein n=1 Tax=Prauserella oleivorans TaxID=1478153 RepID=A0ABW5W8S7_9PSEU